MGNTFKTMCKKSYLLATSPWKAKKDDIVFREVVITSAIDEDPPCVGGRGQCKKPPV